MSEEILRAIENLRGEMLGKFDRMESKVDRIDARLGSVENAVNEISVSVATLTVGQRESRDTLGVIEAQLKVIDKRLDRIERHTGLVKAGGQ